jgi:hypothetical protein
MVKHSDVLGPPNWKDISSLASLNAKQLLTRYASVHTMQRPFPYWDPANDVELVSWVLVAFCIESQVSKSWQRSCWHVVPSVLSPYQAALPD